MRFLVYECLFEHGPLTGAEIDERLRGDRGGRGHYHKRLSELYALDLISDVKIRACSITGEQVTEWDVTSNLPKDSPAKVDQKKVLAAAERAVVQAAISTETDTTPPPLREALAKLREAQSPVDPSPERSLHPNLAEAEAELKAAEAAYQEAQENPFSEFSDTWPQTKQDALDRIENARAHLDVMRGT